MGEVERELPLGMWKEALKNQMIINRGIVQQYENKKLEFKERKRVPPGNRNHI